MIRLHDDFCKISLIVPAAEAVQMDLIVKILEMMINFWFDCYKHEPDNIKMWRPSKELRRYRWRLKGPNPRSGEVAMNQKLSDIIILWIWKRCRDRQIEQENIFARENAFGLGAQGQKGKLHPIEAEKAKLVQINEIHLRGKCCDNV